MDADEILVLGGGPAGCAAARLLAMWGHSVRLITKPAADGELGLAESLTPSCGKFFDLLGIRDTIDAAGFVRTTGNTVWWEDDTPRVERFANDAWGWQVTAPRLDAVMRHAAQDVGVRIDERVLSASEAAATPARFHLDCSGRAGILARTRGGRVQQPGHRTVALSAVWRADAGWGDVDPTHTLIESYADGWVWSVPIDFDRRAVAVMVDPRTSSLLRGEGALATYLGELQKTRRMQALVAGTIRESVPVGWDASMYRSTQYVGDDWLLAGDAASFVDPLSSAGVKKALASGWLAAIVVHTVLVRPAMAAAARQFFADREAEMYANFLALTERHLHDAALRQAQPFWTERIETRAWDERRGVEAEERAAIEAAYEGLRSADGLSVVVGPGVRIESRAAISGSEIVLEPRLVTAADSAGTRFLYDVDVVTMVELAPQYRDVPDLYDACVNRVGPMALPAFLTALATAVARRWLIPA